MSLLNFLGIGPPEDSRRGEIEGVRTIVEALRSLDPERARYLAAFAYVLSRIAHVDQHVSPEETAAIEHIVETEGHLAADQARLVVEIARAQSVLFGGVEDFLVTRELSTRSYDDRLALLHCLFAVSAADQHIAAIEDNEVRRISRELRVEHGDYIKVRAGHRQHLGVLKNPSAS